ncbi:MAG TPA: class I SAM-dependent methyltransferase [Thermoanaerobaculia bacterium]|nr:class I SAM-dependent methyltransferase [Thermoanaerobaculia bacterium]
MWRPIERLTRYAEAAWIDLRVFLAGKTDPDSPPLRLRFVGDGDFEAVGDELADLVLAHGRVHPNSTLLDIGCGIGRVAQSLARRLPREVEYDGFDVVRGAIRWCRRRITRDHPNFRFRHVSVRSSEYALFGVPAAEFRFPSPNERFDCAFAFSLFTHLTLPEMSRYLRESSRVLKPGGRLVATFFLLNEESTPRLASLQGLYRFPVIDGPMRLADGANPAEAVAIDEGALAAEIIAAGFRRHTMLRGQWCGRAAAASFQDLVVCEK